MVRQEGNKPAVKRHRISKRYTAGVLDEVGSHFTAGYGGQGP